MTPVSVSWAPYTMLIVHILAETRENEKKRHQNSPIIPFIMEDRRAFLFCLLDLCFSLMSSGVNSLRGGINKARYSHREPCTDTHAHASTHAPSYRLLSFGFSPPSV